MNLRLKEVVRQLQGIPASKPYKAGSPSHSNAGKSYRSSFNRPFHRGMWTEWLAELNEEHPHREKLAAGIDATRRALTMRDRSKYP